MARAPIGAPPKPTTAGQVKRWAELKERNVETNKTAVKLAGPGNGPIRDPGPKASAAALRSAARTATTRADNATRGQRISGGEQVTHEQAMDAHSKAADLNKRAASALAASGHHAADQHKEAAAHHEEMAAKHKAETLVGKPSEAAAKASERAHAASAEHAEASAKFKADQNRFGNNVSHEPVRHALDHAMNSQHRAMSEHAKDAAEKHKAGDKAGAASAMTRAADHAEKYAKIAYGGGWVDPATTTKEVSSAMKAAGGNPDEYNRDEQGRFAPK